MVAQEQDPHILAEPLPVHLMAPPKTDGLAWHACKVPFMVVTSEQGSTTGKRHVAVDGTTTSCWKPKFRRTAQNPQVCDPERNPQLRKIHSNKKTSPPHSDSSTSIKYVSLQTQYCPIEKSSSRRKRNAMSPQSQKEIPQEKSRYLAPQTASRCSESHQRQEY